MANENVEFSRGQSSDIPPSKVPGRFLIETDTGAMYLDDSAYNRIQIKDPTKIQGINSETLTVEDQGNGVRKINVKVDESEADNALVSSYDGLSVAEVKISDGIQPTLNSKTRLWVDLSADPESVVIDADTLSGHNGDFYTNLSNANGVLPITKGGTGVTTLSALKSLLGIPNFSYGTGVPSGGSDGDIYFQYK